VEPRKEETKKGRKEGRKEGALAFALGIGTQGNPTPRCKTEAVYVYFVGMCVSHRGLMI
jgi:hypothetical protein